ncbi:Myosin heavy chain B [Pseudomonas amygdali pv. hibisci]|uniref:Myosin heavy chain B n=2 Tax=Pseudomonas TaxID=286 RepID=A0AB34UHU6_PSEA0|nr:Myosin heavy chain B [Pseudomonas amygdali pv. hibisci]RMN53474.1 Myosin heavy chain B [Pseudomonas amygdali pv. hibisci]
MLWKKTMKKADLYSLQALRLLREQRAAAHLGAQRERCRDSHTELDQAREKLRLHREQLAREAEQAVGQLGEGLSVSEWKVVQERLKQLHDERKALQADADNAVLNLETEEQARKRLRQAHLEQLKKSRAWQNLVEQRMRNDARASEQRDEADQADLPVKGSPPGDEQ